MREMQPGRILVFGMTENPGGVESFLMNYYRALDREKLQFDFLVNTADRIAYEDELLALGGRLYRIPARSRDRRGFQKELDILFREHHGDWDAVWVNVSSLANIDYLKVAKKYGIRKRIIHSHNSRNMDSSLRALLHLWNRLWVGRFATDFWACSEDAARWFYNAELRKRCVIVHNAIDVDSMRYDQEKGLRIRAGYGWQGIFVIGNVGRLHFQKNQKFALEIFRCFHAEHPESVLVLVGQGEDEADLKALAARFHLEDSVFFAGVQTDIQAWLSCFDCFLFPSVFEGLGIAALEAQANGLPVLASRDVVPEEVKINSNVVFLDLNAGAAAWAHQIQEMRGLRRTEFVEIKIAFQARGYDIRTEACRLENALLAAPGGIVLEH